MTCCNLAQEKTEQEAINLAARIQDKANQTATPQEKANLLEIAEMVQHPDSKLLITEITDQVFRTRSNKRAADQLHYLLTKRTLPEFFSPFQKFGMKLFIRWGKFLPFLFIPLARQFIYQKASRVIVPGEKNLLEKHLEKMKAEGVQLNLNHLGEAILGEEEADARLSTYLEDLANPLIGCISVKVSTLYSQIQLLAFEHTLAVLTKRYKELLLNSYPDKFITLDMEEYRDLRLTVELFKRVLSDKECKNISAGIVLQSYLPDSKVYQKELTEFALARVRSGGAPIKIRLVKGANLAMEKVESSIKGWPLAPYGNKADADASYIEMLIYAMTKEHAAAVKIGVGSHNVFDLTYAWILASRKGVGDAVTIEMLEGMAEPTRRVIQKIVKNLLLYSPVVMKDEFQNAIAYLIRRLDENTGKNNFLREAFHLIPGSKAWNEQEGFFKNSILHANEVGHTPNRTQDRNLPPVNSSGVFQNEPDTDFSLPQNIAWGQKILKEWKEKEIAPIPLVIGGAEVLKAPHGVGVDPARPSFFSYTYQQANERDISLALDAAEKAFQKWENVSYAERMALLEKIAHALRQGRKSLMGACLRDVSKTLYESDAEISEAVDFATYYKKSLSEWAELKNVKLKPKGVVVVASPWNFPCSIPAGGILGALAAGNAVIFKPAPEAVLVGYELVKLFYEAGVPKDLLQFLPCGDHVASILVQDSRTSAVLLTGGTKTAKHLLHLHPGMDLIAETGGKNSMIVTALSDRDLAVRDIVQSAFGYAGQKCSACSVVILEAEVFDDPQFKKQLKDAVSSLAYGSPYDPATKVNPLIRPPEGPLSEAMLFGTWLIAPRIDPSNPHLVTPGIKWGDTLGSFTQQNELFGPILSVIRAQNLTHAVEIANSTCYGLTAGLHSLDDREHKLWLKGIKAGNCYINRGITGAIVERQPFGGTKQSSFGPGLKAGGPNYLFNLLHVEQTAPCSVEESRKSYQEYWDDYFSKDHDRMQLLGQSNIQRYVPHELVNLRILPGDHVDDALKVYYACQICNTSLRISVHPDCALLFQNTELPCKVEKDEEFLVHAKHGRIRLFRMPAASVVKVLSARGIWQVPKPVVSNGRIELLNYIREVSISYDYHRYGNLGSKSDE